AFAGFGIKRVQLGPLYLGKHSSCGEPYCGDVLTLGLAALQPRVTDQSDTSLRRRLLVLSLGGPIANLLLAATLALAPELLQSGFLLGFALRMGAAFSALLTITALLPDVNRHGSFSDGARLLMLLKNDEKAARWLSNIRCQIALNQGQHPRGWDEVCVTQSASVNDNSSDAFAARWMAYLWAAERQDITCATKHLEGALESLSYATPKLRNNLFLEASVFQAWFRDNPAKALFWVYRICKNSVWISPCSGLKAACLMPGKSYAWVICSSCTNCRSRPAATWLKRARW